MINSRLANACASLLFANIATLGQSTPLNEQGLQSLATRLKLPKGWQYRVRKLGDDFIVRNSGGKVHVIQDDLQNSYELM
jgi:hypothetical protein